MSPYSPIDNWRQSLSLVQKSNVSFKISMLGQTYCNWWQQRVVKLHDISDMEHCIHVFGYLHVLCNYQWVKGVSEILIAWILPRFRHHGPQSSEEWEGYERWQLLLVNDGLFHPAYLYIPARVEACWGIVAAYFIEEAGDGMVVTPRPNL